MKRRWSVYALFVSVSLFPGVAHAIDCSSLPTQFTGNEFPTGNFFSNFNNSCYLIPFARGNGGGAEGSDLNSIYDKAFYKVDPRYQLIIIGSFPNTRYFSITDYDTHGATAQFVSDANIVPLTSAYINPYQPGATFVNGQKYAVPVNFGGTPGTLETGCMMNGFNVDVNVEPVHHAAGLQRTWSASKIDGHCILLPVHESSSWLIWVNVGGGQGHDVRIRNELRRGPMGIVIRDREVTGIRERSYNDELVAGVDLVERLVIYAVQIAPFGASPVAS